jgi:hypothetical protein
MGVLLEGSTAQLYISSGLPSINGEWRMGGWCKPRTIISSGPRGLHALNNASGQADVTYQWDSFNADARYVARTEFGSFPFLDLALIAPATWVYSALERLSATSMIWRLGVYSGGTWTWYVQTSTNNVTGRGAATRMGLNIIGGAGTGFSCDFADYRAWSGANGPTTQAAWEAEALSATAVLTTGIIDDWVLEDENDLTGRINGVTLTSAGTILPGDVPPPGNPGTVYTDAGQGTLATTGSGADALVAADAGQGLSAAQGAGADSLSTADAGAGVVAPAGAGADTATTTDAGQGALSAGGAGLDDLAAVDAGAGVLSASAGGDEALVTAETGGGVAETTGAGLDVLAMADAGAGLIGAVAGGADTFSGATVYTDAGQGTATGVAGGADALVVVETGGGLVAAGAAGADVFISGSVWNETGGAAAGLLGAGADAVLMVETGGGLLVARGAGLDVWGVPQGMPGPGAVVARPLVGRVVARPLTGDVAPGEALSGRVTGDALTGRVTSGALTGRVSRED